MSLISLLWNVTWWILDILIQFLVSISLLKFYSIISKCTYSIRSKNYMHPKIQSSVVYINALVSLSLRTENHQYPFACYFHSLNALLSCILPVQKQVLPQDKSSRHVSMLVFVLAGLELFLLDEQDFHLLYLFDKTDKMILFISN